MEERFFKCPDLSSFREVLCPHSGEAITLLHVNIRSLRKYWDQFSALVKNSCTDFDVLVLTEINVDDNLCDTFFFLGTKVSFARDKAPGVVE